MSEQQLFDFLISTVKGDRHRWYGRTVEVAQWCYMVMTGDDQRKILVKYKARETEQQQEQRVHITNSKTQYIGNKVSTLFNEIARADNVHILASYNEVGEAATEKQTILNQALYDFYQQQDLKTYLDYKVKYYNFYDPNAFFVSEFENINPINEPPTTYPLEVSSSAAVNYEYNKWGLAALVVHREKTYVYNESGKEKTEIVDKYIAYGRGVSYTIEAVPEKAFYEFDSSYTQEKIEIDDEEKTYYWKAFETGTEAVPAIRAGYFPDPTTKGETFVSPLWPAEKLITDLIWKKSEYDLSHALHGYYQKFMYVDECNQKNYTGDECEAGYYPDGKKCTACNGSGMSIHTTVQDVVYVKLPDSKSEAIPLSDFVHYVQMPMELVQLQRSDLDELEKDIFSAILNENIFERNVVAQTATEARLNWRSVYNMLSPFADKYSEIYTFFVGSIAEHMQIAENLINEHSFNKDFRLESVDELLQQRQLAINASAPYDVIKNIDYHILSKQHREDPSYLKLHDIKEMLRPFRGKTESERMFIISSLPELNPQRVLWLYFDEIISELLHSDLDLLGLRYRDLREEVDKMVRGKIDELRSSTEEDFIFADVSLEDEA